MNKTFINLDNTITNFRSVFLFYKHKGCNTCLEREMRILNDSSYASRIVLITNFENEKEYLAFKNTNALNYSVLNIKNNTLIKDLPDLFYFKMLDNKGISNLFIPTESTEFTIKYLNAICIKE
jgi:hypothetical protein